MVRQIQSERAIMQKPSVIQIWEDLHNERPGYFRAFWCESPEATTGCTVIGYCSSGGSRSEVRHNPQAQVRQ